MQREDTLNVIRETKGKLPRLPFLDMKNKILGTKYDLSIAFVGRAKSRELNKRFRDKDYADAVRLAKKAGDSPQRAFLQGVAMLRLGKADEGLPLLVEAESKLPLVGDYAALYQAEALLKLKKTVPNTT